MLPQEFACRNGQKNTPVKSAQPLLILNWQSDKGKEEWQKNQKILSQKGAFQIIAPCYA
ncbi:MAG: hypothetical protein LBL94_01130 [Prevotellaceae bacterium]|jgi:hypothetical protein|nr:hypothetical protein [Prevotellaceae bacterium]